MAQYILRRKLDLSDNGKEWKDCFITYREPSTEEVQRMSEAGTDIKTSVGFLQKHFIEGKGYTDKGIVAIKAEEIGQLPMSILNKSIDFLLDMVGAGLKPTKS